MPKLRRGYHLDGFLSFSSTRRRVGLGGTFHLPLWYRDSRRLGGRVFEQVPVDKTTDWFFSPRNAPFGFFSLWDTRSVVPSKGTGEATDKEEEIVNDDEYSDEGDPHYSQAR